MGLTEDRISKNAPKCGANVQLTFKGVVPVAAKYQNGTDYTRLDLLFSDDISIKVFDPRRSPRDKTTMMTRLAYLADALNEDVRDIPPCKGGWEEFVTEVVNLIHHKKGMTVFAKITLNEAGWIEPGEGKCFSKVPDMEFTDADTRFLPDVEVIAPRTHIGFENLPGQTKDPWGSLPELPGAKPKPPSPEKLAELWPEVVKPAPTPSQEPAEDKSRAEEDQEWLDAGKAFVEAHREEPEKKPEPTAETKPKARKPRTKKGAQTMPSPIPERGEEIDEEAHSPGFDDLPF